MTSAKAWIYFVLVCFIGLIMPNEIWHHCDNIHVIVNDKDHKSTYFSQDNSCAVCDFHFYPAVENPVFQYAFAKMIHPNLEVRVDEFTLVVKSTLFLRGPPKWMTEA